ncbi:MAG: Uma2 family endonuclease [Chloroflexi bacterium]|nr:Uma2 family endonuclease [Chloroflexota bacterium]
MGETDKHRRIMTALIEALIAFFKNIAGVYVSGNLMLYYEEGNPSACVSPDVFVIRGVGKNERRVYKLWEEVNAPDVVIEITSRSTRLEDLGNKRALYAELGVAEYFIYDPNQEYLKPPLQGYRLAQNDYAPIAPDAQGKFHSAILNLDLQIVNDNLRLFNPHTQKFLLTPLEAQEAVEQAETENARLRAELKKLREEK